MAHTNRVIAIAALLTAGCAGGAYAQQTIPHNALAPGGRSNDAVYQLYGVVGQPVAGELSGAAHLVRGGYVYVVKDFFLGTPTTVAITQFEATLDGTSVVLSWAIGHSRELRGFHVYRAAIAHGPFVRVTSDLLSPEDAYVFVDTNLEPGTSYYYRLGAIDLDGEFFSAVAGVTTPAWHTELRQNTPNPFNPTTTISYYLAQPGRVSLTIYAVGGRRVADLVSRVMPRGTHEVNWNGTNDQGETVGSGVYFYRLVTGGEAFTKKLTLLK